jgi:acyl-CoA reductase-like NAD-dependent aldehyde dehydrogenase
MELASVKGSVLDAFEVALIETLKPYMEKVEYSAGDTIFRAGEPSDSFYILESGEVAVEMRDEELDTESVLDYLGPGSFLGEVSVLARTPREVNAVAREDVVAQQVSAAGLRRLFDEAPRDGIDALRALARNAALQLEQASAQVSQSLADSAPDFEVEEMVRKARAAQAEFESWDEERVDALLGDIAETVSGKAQELGEKTMEETHLGRLEDKIAKIGFASMAVYESLEGKPAAGEIGRDDENKIVELASPVGVVVALVPVTNPVETIVNKVLISLKGRNAIIISSHRMAQVVGDMACTLIREVIEKHGAPADLIQWFVKRTSRRKTSKLMRHEGIGMILATGGQSMVRAAYSSGKPAIGVGAGNAPAWIAPDADLDKAAMAVVVSKGFDYGLICGSEQHLVVDSSIRDDFSAALERQGAVVLDKEGTEKFMAGAFEPTGDLKMLLVGQSAARIAEACGLEVPEDAKLLVFEADASNPEGAQAHERLAPVLSFFTVDGDDEAVELCGKLLDYHGAGHTSNVHTQDQGRIDRFAAAMPTGRVLVNSPSSLGCAGVSTGLPPSLTLGCGTYGGNSTTDNVSYRNLLNIKRVARALDG